MYECFQGRTALVAGAGGGIGLNIAQDLIGAGANVVLADMKPAPDGIPEGPGGHRYCAGDLTDESFVREVVATAVQGFGGLDYLVNTVGVLWFDRDKSCLDPDMDMDVWDQVFRINVKSMALTARYAVPEMRKAGGGAMVHFSSIDATMGDSKPQDAYGASKAAVIRLSKSLAVQCAADGIRSNTILPAGTASPMQERWERDPAALERLAQAIPLGRVGRTQDMSDACMFLLSDKSSFITGTELVVDGGVTAGG
jgi:3-oxoacyl-[acyl-carrier protein] reductase